MDKHFDPRKSVSGGPKQLPMGPPLTSPIVVDPTAYAGGRRLGKAPEVTAVKVESTPVDANTGDVLGSEWERIDLPSGFVPYEWSDISIRRFGVMDHAKIARANRHKNTSLLLDVLSSTCNRDARDLVFNDFQAVAIWHKLNSYISIPYTITWTSKYGARGTQTVTTIEPRETKIKHTREEYLEWMARGFALPTARDVEVFDSVTDDKEDVIFLFDRAQWLSPIPLQARIAELEKQGDRAASVTARIEELDRRGISSFAEIEKFAEEYSDFGVKEYVKTKLDMKTFKPLDAIAALKLSGTPEHLAEAERFQRLVDAGKETLCAPEAEEVPLAFSLWGMFPYC